MLGAIFVLAFLGTSAIAQISKLQPCELDEGFDSCFNDFVTKNIPILASTGVPEVNIPPLDPFKVPSFQLRFTHDLLKGRIEVKNIFLKGLARTELTNFETSIGKPYTASNEISVNVHTFHPALTVEGKYQKSSLVAMGTKISESGTFKIDLTDVRVYVSAKGQFLPYNDSSYYAILDKLDLDKLDIGDLKISGSDFVQDNPKLSKTLLDMANSMWRVFYTEVYPYVRLIVESESKQLINGYLKGLPISASNPVIG